MNDGRLEVIALDRAWGCLGPAQSSNHAATTADVGWDDSMTAAMAEPAACSSGTANLRDGTAQCWRWQEHREMLATAHALNTSRFFNRSGSGSGCRACSHGSSGDGMAHLQLPYLLHIRNRDYLELSDFRGVAAATWGALSFLTRPAAVQLSVGTPIAFVLAPSNFSHVPAGALLYNPLFFCQYFGKLPVGLPPPLPAPLPRSSGGGGSPGGAWRGPGAHGYGGALAQAMLFAKRDGHRIAVFSCAPRVVADDNDAEDSGRSRGGRGEATLRERACAILLAHASNRSQQSIVSAGGKTSGRDLSANDAPQYFRPGHLSSGTWVSDGEEAEADQLGRTDGHQGNGPNDVRDLRAAGGQYVLRRCRALQIAHSVIPGVSWGTLPRAVASLEWRHMGCDWLVLSANQRAEAVAVATSKKKAAVVAAAAMQEVNDDGQNGGGAETFGAHTEMASKCTIVSVGSNGGVVNASLLCVAATYAPAPPPKAFSTTARLIPLPLTASPTAAVPAGGASKEPSVQFLGSACSQIEVAELYRLLLQVPSSTAVAALVMRGGCTFADKLFHIELANYALAANSTVPLFSAVLVVDAADNAESELHAPAFGTQSDKWMPGGREAWFPRLPLAIIRRASGLELLRHLEQDIGATSLQLEFAPVSQRIDADRDATTAAASTLEGSARQRSPQTRAKVPLFGIPPPIMAADNAAAFSFSATPLPCSRDLSAAMVGDAADGFEQGKKAGLRDGLEAQLAHKLARERGTGSEACAKWTDAQEHVPPSANGAVKTSGYLGYTRFYGRMTNRLFGFASALTVARSLDRALVYRPDDHLACFELTGAGAGAGSSPIRGDSGIGSQQSLPGLSNIAAARLRKAKHQIVHARTFFAAHDSVRDDRNGDGGASGGGDPHLLQRPSTQLCVRHEQLHDHHFHDVCGGASNGGTDGSSVSYCDEEPTRTIVVDVGAAETGYHAHATALGGSGGVLFVPSGAPADVCRTLQPVTMLNAQPNDSATVAVAAETYINIGVAFHLFQNLPAPPMAELMDAIRPILPIRDAASALQRIVRAFSASQPGQRGEGGGRFLCVHWRRGDFDGEGCRADPSCFQPLSYSAARIAMVARTVGYKTVFVATDAAAAEREELSVLLLQWGLAVAPHLLATAASSAAKALPPSMHAALEEQEVCIAADSCLLNRRSTFSERIRLIRLHKGLDVTDAWW